MYVLWKNGRGQWGLDWSRCVLAGLAGRKDGWSWLAGVRTGLEWQEVGVGVGTRTAMQQRIISSTPCLRVRADSNAMRHNTNRGEQQNRDKEKKEDLHTWTMLCMHSWCMGMEHRLPNSAQGAGR